MPEELNWTDIAQAISAMVAIPGAIVAFVVLFKRDKAREAEIKSLAEIAGQMTKLMQISEARHRDSKKPLISVQLDGAHANGYLRVIFTNSNKQASLKKYITEIPDKTLKMQRYTISESAGEQKFYLEFTYEQPPQIFLILIDYDMGEGYMFSQTVVLVFMDNHKRYSVTCGAMGEKAILEPAPKISP